MAQIDANGQETRTLSSAPCDELTEAIAIVIARIATELRHSAPTLAVVATPPSVSSVVSAPPPAQHLRLEIARSTPPAAGTYTQVRCATAN